MFHGFRNLMTIATVWMTVVSMAIAIVPRVDCVCSNGRTKNFCLSSMQHHSACCCGRTGHLEPGETPSCCRNVSAPNGDSGDPISPDSSTSPSVQRKCCVKTMVAPELASLEECQQLAQASDVFILSSLEPVVYSFQSRNDQYRFPTTRPPVPDLIILLQQFRN